MNNNNIYLNNYSFKIVYSKLKCIMNILLLHIKIKILCIQMKTLCLYKLWSVQRTIKVGMHFKKRKLSKITKTKFGT